MRRARTLRVRFALWTAGLLLVVLTAFGFYIYRSMAVRLSAAVDESLTLVGAQVVAGLDLEGDRLIFSEDFDQEPENVDLRRRGYTVWVFSPDGRLIHAFGPYQDMALPAGQVAPATFYTLTEPRTGDAVRVRAVAVRGETQPAATVQVARSLEESKDTLERLATTLLIGGPGLVAAAGLGGYLLAARALSPIDRITQTARRISGEDLTARLNLPAVDDEVGRLATTFDEMLDRLEQSFRRERQFTADASHELRTPLSAMQTILEAIRDRPRSPQEYEQALADLAEETRRLHSLTEDLLLLARGRTWDGAEREAVELATLLPDLCDSLRPLAQAKSLDLICRATGPLIVQGDRDALVRLFSNLLDNAIKFSDRGEISVTAEPDPNGSVTVHVADRGRGIPAEHLPRVFDRFYRVDPSRSSPGAGLGLAIAQEIAHSHGGVIEAQSGAGQGARFSVKLPQLTSETS